MSEREQAKQIIDLLPEYNYLNDPDPDKDEEITLEELAAREGIEL